VRRSQGWRNAISPPYLKTSGRQSAQTDIAYHDKQPTRHMNILKELLLSLVALFSRAPGSEKSPLEDYLAQSQNVADLEQREHNWNSGRARQLGV